MINENCKAKKEEENVSRHGGWSVNVGILDEPLHPNWDIFDAKIYAEIYDICTVK